MKKSELKEIIKEELIKEVTEKDLEKLLDITTSRFFKANYPKLILVNLITDFVLKLADRLAFEDSDKKKLYISLYKKIGTKDKDQENLNRIHPSGVSF